MFTAVVELVQVLAAELKGVHDHLCALLAMHGHSVSDYITDVNAKYKLQDVDAVHARVEGEDGPITVGVPPLSLALTF